MKNTFLILSFLINVFIASDAVAVDEKNPFMGFCKNKNQTFTQCVDQAQKAYEACKTGVTESEEDSMNVVTDKYSLKYCQNTRHSLMRWCELNCKH